MTSIPNSAEVVIIGGGIAGCSIAYHLAKLGVSDVVLLERKQLTCGTTWHAAGLVTQLRANRRMTELAYYTGKLFGTLEEETGMATGYVQRGSLRLAKTAARYEELARGASMGRNFGLPVQPVTPGEIKERWSPVNVDDIVGGFWFPDDGQVNPIDVTMAYAKGARMGGAKIIEQCVVENIIVEGGKAVAPPAAEARDEEEEATDDPKGSSFCKFGKARLSRKREERKKVVKWLLRVVLRRSTAG